MKILQVTPFFLPDVGGISNHVLNLSKNLQTLGEEMTIVSPIKILKENKKDPIFSTIRIRSFYLFGWPYPTLKNMSIPIDMGLKINNLLKNGNYDIVHVHGQHFPITWITIHSAYKHKIPSILTIHGTYGLNPFKIGGETALENYFNKIVFARILKKVTAIIGVTEKNVKYAKRYTDFSKKFFVIPNGIDTQLFKENLNSKIKFRNKYNIDTNNIVILFCGRFEHVKGVIEFAEASKKIGKEFTEVEILIVGQGSLQNEVESIIKNIPNIHLLPWQSEEKLMEIYILSDIFAIPSKFEGLPIALLEAMAASLHILYTPVGSVPELVENYNTKTLINSSTYQEIYVALKNIIINFNKKSSPVIYSKNFDKYDWKSIAEGVKKVYEKCIVNL